MKFVMFSISVICGAKRDWGMSICGGAREAQVSRQHNDRVQIEVLRLWGTLLQTPCTKWREIRYVNI